MVESQQAWLESLIYQSKILSHEQLQTQLGGVTAFAKAQGGIIFEYCASTEVNLFGGLGLTKGGQGERVERLWRDCKIAAIPGTPIVNIVNYRWFGRSFTRSGDASTNQDSEKEGCQDIKIR
jgi:alkylation response protein AidB-like acyl-CoA dehydrogenase